MQTRSKVLLGIAVVAVFALATIMALRGGRERGIEVRMDEITRRNLVSTVTASGNIRARRTVDISSDVSARVAELLIDEGDDVEAGQTLVRLDPSQFQASSQRARAALSQTRAQSSQTSANLIQAERNFNRLMSLYQRDTLLVSPQQLEDAETSLEVARANMQGAEFGVEQAQASLEEANEALDKTIIRAPISGKVTRLNVEEGETVIIGTMNNPGSLVLTISDLAVVEAVVQVDETDVPEISLGDSASVSIDAFPNLEFAGRITEIGNSAIQPPSAQSSGQQAAIDFEVVITLTGPPVELRPDLSATAEIVTETRENALSIPIIALTVRDRDVVDSTFAVPVGDEEEFDDVEGVFVVTDGVVSFRPVEVGIAGTEYFEVLSGLDEGETVVAGPYQVIRQLQPGDAVQEAEGEIEGG